MNESRRPPPTAPVTSDIMRYSPPGSHPTEPSEEYPTDEVILVSHFLGSGLENNLPPCSLSLPVFGLGHHLVTSLGKALLFIPPPSACWPASESPRLGTMKNQDPQSQLPKIIESTLSKAPFPYSSCVALPLSILLRGNVTIMSAS